MKSFPFLLCVGLTVSKIAFAQTQVPGIDYPAAIWTPAADGNFEPQNRPQSKAIDMVIVHDIEGPASAGVSIFQRPGANVSAHYVVGGDGQVFQLVREANVAWHAGNRDINQRSIGIETEGYSYRPGWYNSKIYESEARLIRDITQRYSIPRDRTHIIGHFEVPNPRDPTKFGGLNGHTDPGPYWDWATFMTLIRNDAHLVEAIIPPTIRPGEVLPVSVTLENTGDDSWPANTAPSPNTALQASGPIIVLGTEANQPSPFFDSKSWLGPSIVAGASLDTLPHTQTRFEFALRGPSQLGDLNQKLRLSTLPIAAQGVRPVAFGDEISVTTRVVPWMIDATTPDPATDVSAPEKPIAKWSPKLPLAGIWAVYVLPPKPSKTRKQKPFSYQLGTQTYEVAAKEGGNGPFFAGYFEAKTPSFSAELQSAPQGVDASNAGAVRFVGPFPAASNTAPELTPYFSHAAS